MFASAHLATREPTVSLLQMPVPTILAGTVARASATAAVATPAPAQLATLAPRVTCSTHA